VPRDGCTDRVVLDLWHPIAALAEIGPGVEHRTTLLETQLCYSFEAGTPTVWRAAPGTARTRLPTLCQYGYLWTSLGTPPPRLFAIPEYDEPDRRRLCAATIGVAVSAPRAVENFLDMAHFPYVHSGVLGAEPRTEVVDHDVEIDPDTGELWARRCRFYQPVAAPTATAGQVTEYVYRIPHPYCVLLYKSYPVDPSRMDVIGLFLQAVSEEEVRAHNFLCMLDEVNDDTAMRRFQLGIFGQDKPILENQMPKRLPLDLRAETSVKADKSSVAYRRWLSDLGVTYAVIPAA
jgi:phenylpropionate dioxygenase-like ring-hydroxylating dioxygenase large terminal subunit